MSPWKKRGLIALAVLVFGVLCFSAGRFAAPSKVIVAQAIQFREVEKIREVEVVKWKTAKAKTEIVYRDVTTAPDGTVTDRSVVKSAETETATADKTATRDTDKATESSVKTETITVNDAPRLTVMVLAGYQHAPGVNLIPNVGPFSVGASVTYRFAGPLTAGAVVTSTGGVWAGLGAQF